MRTRALHGWSTTLLIAEDVRKFAAEREKVNRIYAEGLPDIRKASKLTQQQVAEQLVTDQGTVSKIKRRDDLLLSTLRLYLAAAGVLHPKIVVEKDGVEIALDLDALGGGQLNRGEAKVIAGRRKS
ncbi:MAG: helix-turn-helix domain-containing protein [Mycobacterium sp.]